MNANRRMTCLFAAAYCCAMTALANDILRNGSNDWVLVSGEIPFWTEVVGSNWTQRSENPTAQHGVYYFFAGAGSTAELRQDIDVSGVAESIDAGSQTFTFHGWFRSWNQTPPDTAFTIFEMWNTDFTTKLWSDTTGKYVQDTAWLPDSLSNTAPVGTRWLRLRLISKRASGTNNDGYFDDLSINADPCIPTFPMDLTLHRDGEDVVLNWRGCWSAFEIYSDTLSTGEFSTLEGVTSDTTFRDTLGLDRAMRYYQVVAQESK